MKQLTKSLLAALALISVSAVWANPKAPAAAPAPAAAAVPAAASGVSGEVMEVLDVESYTYLRLKTASGDVWAAVPTAKVKKGAKVTLQNPMTMTNFESKTLKKKFDTILFATLAGGDSAAASAPSAPAAASAPIKVAKATGAGAYTVAEVIAKRTELKGKSVQIRGQVVKFTAGIMKRNWVHLQDGSGTAAAKNQDILVTTLDSAKIGDVVLVKGQVGNDRDFGSGYAYPVLVEEAKLQK